MTEEQRKRSNEASRRWRLRNPEKAKAAQAGWVARNRTKLAADQRARRAKQKAAGIEWSAEQRASRLESTKKWQRANQDKVKRAAKLYRERARDARLEKRYGLPPGKRDELLAQQGRKCAICQMQIGLAGRRWRACVDHCHASGKIRGLLCPACNYGLGQFHDSPAKLRSALEYVMLHGDDSI